MQIIYIPFLYFIHSSFFIFFIPGTSTLVYGFFFFATISHSKLYQIFFLSFEYNLTVYILHVPVYSSCYKLKLHNKVKLHWTGNAHKHHIEKYTTIKLLFEGRCVFVNWVNYDLLQLRDAKNRLKLKMLVIFFFFFCVNSLWQV